MKTCIKILLLVFALVISKTTIATPVITFVTTPASTVPNYDLFEITYQVGYYPSPHDDGLINTYAEFWSPTGKYYKVYGFYFENLSHTSSSTGPNCPPNPPQFCFSHVLCEEWTCNWMPCWKVRFTPNEIGEWKYRMVAVEGNLDPVLFPSPGDFTFESNSSGNKGFIIKSNNRFLQRTTGEFFFPVGINLASNIMDVYGTNEFIYYINRIAGNGNTIRIFLDSYNGLSLIGPENYPVPGLLAPGFNLYNQKDAAQLDLLIEYCKRRDINIMLCLFSHASWGDKEYGNGNWSANNPYNINLGGTLSSPYDFFLLNNNDVAVHRTKNLIKYIISRWGYATNLYAWELWNEVHQIDYVNAVDPHTNPTYFMPWHQEMYKYIKEIDPFNHLVTTSFGDIDKDNASVFNEVDFSQQHRYNNTFWDPNNDWQNTFYSNAIDAFKLVDKPTVVGEWGCPEAKDWLLYDPLGLELHCTNWSASFSTALGTPLTWYWIDYLACSPDLWHLFLPVKKFMNTLPIPSDKFKPERVVSNGLRTYYMANSAKDTIYGWVQDINYYFQSLHIPGDINHTYLSTLVSPKPQPSSNDNRVTLPVNENNRTYYVQWYDAETADPSSTPVATVVSSNNEIIIEIPQDLRISTFGDAVFKIFMDCSNSVWREHQVNNEVHDASIDIVTSKYTGEVFFKNNSGQLNSLKWDPVAKSWHLTDLDNAASNVAGDLVVNEYGTQVYYRTTNNHINSIWYNVDHWVWSGLNESTGDPSLPGNVKGPLAICSTGQLFYTTLDNKLHSIWFDPNANSGNGSWIFSNLNNKANANVADAIAITSDNQVFFRTSNNDLQRIWYDPNANGAGNGSWMIGNRVAVGNVGGSLAVSSDDRVFYSTINNDIKYVQYLGGQWTPQTISNCPTNVAGGLTIDNHDNLFYRTTGSGINAITIGGGNFTWSELDHAADGLVLDGNLSSDNYANVFFESGTQVHRIFYRSHCFDYIDYDFLRKGKRNDSSSDLNDKLEVTGKFNLYPNPVANMLNVESNKKFTGYRIFNMQNQVMQVKDELNSLNNPIDVSMLKDGIYLMKLIFEDKNECVRKFVINHR